MIVCALHTDPVYLFSGSNHRSIAPVQVFSVPNPNRTGTGTTKSGGGGGGAARLQMKMQIWDTAGQEKFGYLSSGYYRNVDALILCFDAANGSLERPAVPVRHAIHTRIAARPRVAGGSPRFE